MAVDQAIIARLSDEVGCVTEGVLGEISRELIARYASAVGDRNPIYLDPKAAREAGYADVVAPPNLLTSVITWSEGAPYDELREDGTEVGTLLPGIPASGVRIMGGGERMRFCRPVVAGTTVSRLTELQSVESRESPKGELLVATFRDVYRDADGEDLLVSTRTVLLR